MHRGVPKRFLEEIVVATLEKFLEKALRKFQNNSLQKIEAPSFHEK